MYKEDIDYRFIDIEDTDLTAVQLLLKKYEGVIYHYHKARIKEENGIARLQFGYTIIQSGNHDIDDLNSSEEFHTIMGDILTILLMSKAKEDESFRDNNTKKFDLQ
jgi:hypothetical protein